MSERIDFRQTSPPAWVAAWEGAAHHLDTMPPVSVGYPRVAAAPATQRQVLRLRFADAAPPAPQAYAREGECAVIFDGRLVNREEVARAAHRSPAENLSDPALVLHLYRACGETFLTRLRGSYAVILWDAEHDILLAARDAMGSVPLFYTRVKEALLFSTSIDALLCEPGVDEAFNTLALAETLAHRYRLPEETYYKAIRRVLQGHALRRHANREENVQYWDPAPPGTPDDSMRVADLAQFDVLLRQAVARAMSQRPSGIYLSGGLDSVSIAAVAANIGRANGSSMPLALSLAFPDPACDEADVQMEVAAGLGLEQVLLPFAAAVAPQGLLAAGLALSATLEAPLQNPWRPAYSALARRSRNSGCRVILTGVGGDDWLTVNSDYMADLLGRGDVIGSYRLLRNMLRSYAVPRLALLRFMIWRSGVRPILVARATGLLDRLMPDRGRKWRRNWLLRRQTVPDWLAPDSTLRQAMKERAGQQVEAILRKPVPRGRYGFYNATNIARTFAYQQPSLEQEEDYNVGRRLGLSFRHPYWDPDLVTFLCRVPPRLLLEGGREKGLVRQAVARRFPDLAFERQRKVSAGSFFYRTLQAQAPAARRHLGALVALDQLGLVDAQRIDATMSVALNSGDNRRQHAVWELLMLETWLRSRL